MNVNLGGGAKVTSMEVQIGVGQPHPQGEVGWG